MAIVTVVPGWHGLPVPKPSGRLAGSCHLARLSRAKSTKNVPKNQITPTTSSGGTGCPCHFGQFSRLPPRLCQVPWVSRATLLQDQNHATAVPPWQGVQRFARLRLAWLCQLAQPSHAKSSLQNSSGFDPGFVRLTLKCPRFPHFYTYKEEKDKIRLRTIKGGK